MKCPYCTSDISEDALVCPNCARDLYLLTPLLSKVALLENEVAELRAHMAAAQESSQAAAEEEVLSPPPSVIEPEVPLTLVQKVISLVCLWLLPLGLLLAAHGAITIVYDLNILYLRIISLIVPLPFGYLLMNRRKRSFALWGVNAFAMAILAVMGMSGITHLVDQTPILPEDMREWREFLEYAASVGFSYLTGMVLGRMELRRREIINLAIQAKGLSQKLAQLISDGKEGAEKVQAIAEKLQSVGGSLTAAATTAVSIYTGLQGFLGGG